jgi:protein gp37
VSEGCKNCYALDLAQHYGFDVFGPTKGRRVFGEHYWADVDRWNAEAERQGHRRNVFCSSMADTFEDHATVEEQRQLRLWPIIARTPWLNWLLLTKRPENMLKMAPWDGQWPDNVWAMTSVENRRRAQERIPILLEVPAVVRGLSVEPQLEQINLSPWLVSLQWVICGGESGAQTRPFDLTWARYLRDQCLEAGVPFFLKQIGGRYHWSGGRELDGRTWDEMPPEFPSLALLKY